MHFRPPPGRTCRCTAAYDQAHQDWVDNHDKYERDCRDTGGAPEECTIPEPTLADFSADPTSFKEAVSTALELSTVLVGTGRLHDRRQFDRR